MDRAIYYKYFDENILPNIMPIEKQRQSIVRSVFLSSFIMILCGVACAWLFIALSTRNNLTILALPVILFLMYVFFIKSITNAIVKGKEYQKKLMNEVLPLFFKPVANFKYWEKNRDISTFLDSGLFRDFEAREDDFSIFGIYKDVNITLNDTKLIIPPNKTIFKGVAIQLEFPKSIDNHVILISKNEKIYSNYSQINPQIDEMNKFMYVFAKNNNVKFINNDLWNIIKRMAQNYTAKGFSISYNNNTVLICMRKKKPLSFGFLLKPLTKPQNYNDLIDMFSVVFDFIDCVQISQSF